MGLGMNEWECSGSRSRVVFFCHDLGSKGSGVVFVFARPGRVFPVARWKLAPAGRITSELKSSSKSSSKSSFCLCPAAGLLEACSL
jgi:hypothetical protein